MKLHIGKLTSKREEKARVVGQSDAACHAHSQRLGHEMKVLLDLFQRLFCRRDNGLGLRVKKLSSLGEADMPRGPLEQRDAQLLLHTADLAGDRALGQSGFLSGLGKAAMLRHEMEQAQLVEIERDGGEEVIHAESE